jgi:hypothetical protein
MGIFVSHGPFKWTKKSFINHKYPSIYDLNPVNFHTTVKLQKCIFFPSSLTSHAWATLTAAIPA